MLLSNRLTLKCPSTKVGESLGSKEPLVPLLRLQPKSSRLTLDPFPGMLSLLSSILLSFCPPIPSAIDCTIRFPIGQGDSAWSNYFHLPRDGRHCPLICISLFGCSPCPWKGLILDLLRTYSQGHHRYMQNISFQISVSHC